MKEYKFKIDGADYTSSVEELDNGNLSVTVNGKTYQVEVPEQKSVSPKVIHHVVHHIGSASPAATKKAPSKLVSPMPGTVIKLNAAKGQKVRKGDVLLVIEAMKMANDIVAEGDGTIKEVLVSLGQNVIQGDILVDFEGAADIVAPAADHKPAAGGSMSIAAPLPGTVKKILVQPGQEVKAGETVLTMEAMKMENNIATETSGKVKAILVKANDQVNQGDVLVELE